MCCRKAYELVPDLLGVDAHVLNTSQHGTTSQDRFQPLQNKQVCGNHTDVIQGLL